MRNGIISAGNWVFDNVKILDTLPEKGMLGSIIDEDFGGGGAPYNVLVDLAKMKINFPLWGAGLVGNDHKGNYLEEEIKRYKINTQYLKKTSNASTSYTDVMTEKNTGARTFFHCRGANALLDYNFLANINVDAKIFHLGYLLLLDELDKEDKDFGVVSARALNMLQLKGYKTSVDVVSESGDRFKRLVVPALQYTDYLILNEIESERISGFQIREKQGINAENLQKTAQYLLDMGVNELVVIHFPEGGYVATKEGKKTFVPSFLVDNKEIKGTVGAGDAFCAGMLYAIHENIDLEYGLKIANASARFNLLDSTSTGGAVSIADIEQYIKTAPVRESIM